MANRIYVPFMMFNVRIVNMQHLWTPSTEYLGKKQEKPSYFITCIAEKTRANWWEEPAFATNWAAYSELLQKSGMTPQHVAEWPIKDGDMPPEPGKAPSDWAKGRWVFGGSSSSPIKVEIVQNGNVVPLPAKVGVKPGDYVALGCSTATKQNNARAIKHFCNTVLFTGAGEEIAVGGGVTGAELMQQAQQQGLQVTGFSGSPVGFASAPGAGFAPHGAGPGGASGFPTQQQGGFPGTPQGPQPGFAPGSGPMAGPAPGAFPGAPAHGGMPGPANGSATSPFSGPGFAPAPGAFPGPSGPR